MVRDLFTEDFARLVIQGDDAWDLVDGYVSHVAPDLRERLERYRPDDEANDGRDLFATYRIDEQIAKGLDRKVWLPSGGSLVIDRTEAMTVVDVNTGKFTGSGGNLEETVTKNNLEAAEEIVRQLRLRDIGGIIVVDFIDMVLESNRDLVLRRLVECLGRDRTRHQVAEVTSLGLVQMTRKRIGTGLLEAFSEDCEHCKGRGLLVHDQPIEPSTKLDDDAKRGGRRGRSGGRGEQRWRRAAAATVARNGPAAAPSPRDVAAMARRARRQAAGRRARPDTRAGRAGPAARARPGQRSPPTPRSRSPRRRWTEPEQPLASDATPAPEAPSSRGRAGQPAEPRPSAAEPVQPAEPVSSLPSRPRPDGGHVHPAPVARGRAAGPPVSDPGRRSRPQTQVNEHAGRRRRRRSRRAHDGAEPDGQRRRRTPTARASSSHVPIKTKGSRKR